MAEQARPFTWFDESRIETEHDRIVSNNLELQDHLKLFHSAFDFLHECLKTHSYEGDTEALVILRLTARIFNTAGACLKLARAGYFQPAFAMVRDILEVEFLSDLFVRDREQLRRWISIDASARKKEFKQITIREALDKLDGFTAKKRAKEYELLSKHATHVDLDGFQIISPEGMTQIGPFPSEAILTALFQELAKHLQMVCIHLAKLLEPKDALILTAATALDGTIKQWRIKYMSNDPNEPSP
ncbi:MAG TPA: hypothetical protein VK522_21040 [Pseudolabrys sp.]|nr:hypothetical protein [Pseudolabrys sp.]